MVFMSWPGQAVWHKVIELRRGTLGKKEAPKGRKERMREEGR